MTSGRPVRIAILGARGIGLVHSRIFHELGAKVCAVLGSSEKTAAVAANNLRESLGIVAKPFFELTRLLAESLDAISICTPPRLHFAHLMAAFDRGLPVFCEKPLLWEDEATCSNVLSKLSTVEEHPNRRLFVNTSNAAFIDAVRDRFPPPAQVERFSFRFSTQGPHRGRNIAVDLMPHGLSLLIRLMGNRMLSSFTDDSTDTRYRCRFSYGDCQVEFDFQQGHGGPSELAFQVNERELRRIQEGRGSTYRVYLQDVQVGDNVHVEDPFRTYISEFLRYLELESTRDHGAEAAENLRLMAQVLTPRRE